MQGFMEKKQIPYKGLMKNNKFLSRIRCMACSSQPVGSIRIPCACSQDQVIFYAPGEKIFLLYCIYTVVHMEFPMVIYAIKKRPGARLANHNTNQTARWHRALKSR
jgi:hypothetical protein